MNITEVKELYEAAVSGSSEAREVFTEFGLRLKEILLPFIDSFKPDTLVIGGQISKSFMLFGDEITAACKQRGIIPHVSKDTSESTLKGVAMLFG